MVLVWLARSVSAVNRELLGKPMAAPFNQNSNWQSDRIVTPAVIQGPLYRDSCIYALKGGAALLVTLYHHPVTSFTELCMMVSSKVDMTAAKSTRHSFIVLFRISFIIHSRCSSHMATDILMENYN